MKKTKLFLFFWFLILLIPSAVAFNVAGAGDAGTYTSSSAFGNIVEKSVTGTGSDGGFSSELFSWGGPIKNGTGTEGAPTSGLGVSAAGDTYIITFGPLIDEETTAEEETPEEEIEESSGVPSSGGGGGGSSRRDTYGLIAGDKLTVIINGEQHTITILEVRDSSATLLIEAPGIEFELELDETEELDLNNDGLADIAITLDAVSELRKITITVEDLTQREDGVEEVEILEEEQEQVDPLDRITGAVVGLDAEKIEEVSKEVRETTTAVVKYVLFANVIAGILVGSMVAAREIKRRRIYNVFHQPTKQELVELELKKLREYAAAAVKSGRTIYDIKSDLLNAGWFEYEVDEALVDTMLKEKAGFNQMK